MSNFYRSTADEELRDRVSLGYAVGQTFLGTVANPLNFVLFNAAGGSKLIVLQEWIVSTAAVNSVTMFAVNANPALAAGNTPQNRLIGGAASFASWQAAVAAAPATIGVLGAMELAAGIPFELIYDEEYLIPNGAGILVQFPALAGNVFCHLAWYELPV